MPIDDFPCITTDPIDLDTLELLLNQTHPLRLSDSCISAIRKGRTYLERKIEGGNHLFYGINTGFGSLCNIPIDGADMEDLQYNLVASHAAGTGNVVPVELVKIMLLLKIRGLSLGYSGVRLELVERLIALYNQRVYPVLFELGSLGASGDLAPLAHLSLPLIGLGEVWHEQRRQPARVVMKMLGWEPMTFKAKEALALLNGTQFSTAYALWGVLEAKRLLKQANTNAALGYDAFNCRYDPLHPLLHAIRPHQGQVDTAAEMLVLLRGSEFEKTEKQSIQDPYSFRCVPQVHGASWDAIRHVESVILNEINAVTDNPTVFPNEDLILSGGNFHAQALALPLDYLAIALSELGNIAERRIYQLISGQRGLPAFLTPNPGLHSGMMIAQYTAAAIVNQNKMYCTPLSADSIVSCNGQEDHVSMAANSATKLRQVCLNLERLLAIEWMVAAQALDFRRPLKTSAPLEARLSAYRERVPGLVSDRPLHPDIETTLAFLRNNK